MYCLCGNRHPKLRDSRMVEQDEDILLTFLPFFHSYGLMWTVIVALAAAKVLVVLPRYRLKDVLSCIEKYKVG